MNGANMEKKKIGSLTVHNEPDMEKVIQKLFDLISEPYGVEVKVKLEPKNKNKKEKAV